MNYKIKNLEDVATFERAKNGKVYPKGTTIIQVSATKGEVKYMANDGNVEPKYVAVIPKEGINAAYLNIMISKNINEFINKYKCGLNIQEKDIRWLNIEVCSNEKQNEIVEAMQLITQQEAIERSKIETMKSLKNNMLRKMFV